MNTKTKKSIYKSLLPAVFLIACAFCCTQSARADDSSVTKYGVVFDSSSGVGTPNYARIIKKGNIYHMWYEDSALDRMFHTTSNDGQHWAAGQITNTTNVHEPGIIWDSAASKYKLWFEPTIPALAGQIWYSQSDYGIIWDLPVLVTWTDGTNVWENGGRYMPFVMREGSTYKMWYQSFSNVAGEGGDKRINYATSSDGLSWDNSGNFNQVTFGGNGNNNIVLGLGDAGSWDSTSLYSQAIVSLPAQADFNYMMLYAAHDGGRYKLGTAASNDGISWLTEDEYLISGEHDIWFPSVSEEGDGFNIWYVDSTAGSVYFATLPHRNQMEGEKAYISSWEAYRYENSNKSCSSRLKLTIKGKRFDRDAEVRIGDHEASSVDRKSRKKIVAKFCLSRLLDNQASHKKTISVTNPHAKEKEADKEINLDDIGYDVSAGDFGSQSFESVENIQKALSQLGFLDQQYITGVYGPITTDAVRKFQEQNSLPATGFFGPLTKAKLQEKVK
jgi:hypothetical protein